MSKKSLSDGQIAFALRQVEAGMTVGEIGDCVSHIFSLEESFRWDGRVGGPMPETARR